MLHEREESMMCAECGDEFALQVRNGPLRDKTCLWGFRQSETKTSLLSYSD